MIMYHGGTVEIVNPLCGIGRANLDFGKGFYLTDLKGQAESWARRQAADRGENPIINVYEFDYDTVIKKFTCLKFDSYNEAWLDFIVESRRGNELWKGYDVIEGGVANDRVVDTINLYTLGFLDKQAALGNLAQHQPNNQICILNQEVVEKCLEFCNSIKL